MAAKFYGGASRTSYKIYRSKNPTLAREATLVPSSGAKVRPDAKIVAGRRFGGVASPGDIVEALIWFFYQQTLLSDQGFR
ncbi:MAG TPA: hypothetical protein VKC66_23505 [Xanthobacteraceae bacterium]|nr:hypothetical protein [Xanthobacteraceae bacterium]